MWLSLIILAFIIGVAVYQGMQGFYSSLIMMVLTLCCAGLAFGTYEWVAVNWMAKWESRADFASALALGITFGLPLLLLRLLFDQTLRRCNLLPAVVDRVGGGLCALITALVMGGVLAVVLQMVPFGRTFLGYARFDIVEYENVPGQADPDPPDLKKRERELLLTPDRFAVGVASMLSDGLFSGKQSFAEYNPDLIQALGWLHTTDLEVNRYAPPGSISVVGTDRVDYVYTFGRADARARRRGADIQQVEDTYDPIEPEPGKEFRVIRVKLGLETRNKTKDMVFTLRQFRLVGKNPDSEHTAQYFPIATQAADFEDHPDRHVASEYKGGGAGRQAWHIVDTPFRPNNSQTREVELVYELPTGFTPEYIEYKQFARAAVAFPNSTERSADAGRTDTLPALPTSGPTVADSTAADAGQTRQRGGRVRGLGARVQSSHFGNRLPVTMTDYLGKNNVSITRGALASGHLVGRVADQEGGSAEPVSTFDVPDDKRLLQLNVGRLQARSTLGRALSFAVSTLQNYTVQDADGKVYQLVGEYAIADVGGSEIIEVQYFKEQAGSIGGVGKFDRIKDSHLRGDYELVLLFLVDPGVQIESFSTGGAASRRDDLRSENLVAPR